MSFLSFRKCERGSIPVLVALSLSVLFGFAALGVDFGMMAAAKQSLQNAADAAALAGAADLGYGSGCRVNETVKEYCRLNGCDPDSDEITLDMTALRKTVRVTLTKEMDMGFSTVLTGVRQRSVTASATAEATTIFGGCPYAMFAGQRIDDDGTGITIGGNNIQINGNIHSNSDISMRHAVLGSGYTATAVRNIQPSTTGWNSNSIALDMPSFRSFESALGGMPGLVEFYGDVTKNSKGGFQQLIDEAVLQYTAAGNSPGSIYTNGLYIHITGNLTFNGNSSTAYLALCPIVLIVDGNINLNGAPLNSTADFPVCIMSKTGNIIVNGGGAHFTGILYAPNGDVTLNGNDANYVGSIVANNIRKNGGKITVSYYEDADRFLPTTKVHLIA